ncbi:MAG: alpha/beta fold hydrolase [Roseiflexaceae bacterium]
MPRPDAMPAPAVLRPYSRTIAAGGPRLHYYDAGAGAGPPLVLLHGLGDEADTWRHVLPRLAARRRVIAPDLPGFGRSDKPRRAYTTAFFARTIAALLAELGIARAELVGSSMGALVAQRLALARPALVERLALIGGGMALTPERVPPPVWLFLLPGMGELSYTALRRSQDEAYATLRPYYHDLDALPEQDRTFLRERVWARVWSAGQRRAFLSALRWLAIDQATRAATFRERLAQLRIPTLLIWGEHDVIAPRARAEALLELLPDARLRIIAGSGHLPQQERPDELLEALG